MRRLAFAFVAFPLLAYAYACSDDAKEEPPALEDAGGGPETGPRPGDDGGDTPDGNTSTDSGDDGAVVVETCAGNPLTADGGTTDGGVTLDAAAAPSVVTGEFLDGPHYVDQFGGVFVVSEVFTKRVLRVQPDGGSLTPIRTTGANLLPIGNAAAGGDLYTAQSLETAGPGSAILRTNLADGGDAGTFGIATATSPNDLVVSKKGFVYFTDPAYQSQAATRGVYRLTPADGGVTTITTGTAQADGIALSPNEDFLYVSHADTRQIVKQAIDANGNVAAATQLVYTAIDLPAGLAVDVGGNIWIAESHPTPGTNSGRVEVIDATGKKWGEIPFLDRRATNLAFGGPDNKTIAITTEQGNTLSGLHVYRSRCAGIR